ncbi:MSHA pilin protein MshA [Pseudoalteromonas ulvae UL12]|uniref:MSHA biogenesis protein MshA n=1 Tax=Pseudoalteromonas ulvae TaxID=107327 RepID=A0A244CPH7_PSEDV|nr:prepilin-type N-terminal cleavage/methylation domain-containing protein [Pseudoalteromonas ulvae]MBE0364908.1 MSHA pilin protein MshA [Pseudoalteromonas ulvae UL12]OUL57478.1 hypothetical protein B1199_10400 [Pseudoalteromonas ulvae]
MNKKQQGFTLIELIIVIVILGILAVTASPKFLDLQGDANASAIQGVDGSVNGAMNIIYGKSVIAGIQKAATNSITVNGDTINTVYGYPAATAAGIIEALEISVADLSGAGVVNTSDFNFNVIAAGAVIYANGSTAPAAFVAGNGTAGDTNDGCYVGYVAATVTGSVYTPASTVVNTDAC